MSMREIVAGSLMAGSLMMPGEKITYRLLVLSVQDPKAGRTVTYYHDIDIPNAVVESVTVEDLMPSGGAGAVQLGDVIVKFPLYVLANDLHHSRARSTSTSDLIQHESQVYRVTMIQEDVSRSMYIFTCRKVVE